MTKVTKLVKGAVVSSIAAVAMTASAHAGGDIEAPMAVKSSCGLSANVAITSDYVFRGISQTREDAAVSGGVDLTCGIFYAGVWASNVDFAGSPDTTVEVDFYAGVQKEIKGVTIDAGVLVYTYDDADDLVELKLGLSGEVYKGATLGVTGYFDVDNEVYTYEASMEKSLPKVGAFSPSLSGTVGTVTGDGADDYTFWNAGLSLGFAEKFAVDFRYHDTDIKADDLADERFVATLSASF